MPIYEYTCQACGHALEAIQKFSDPALCECPVCRKPELKKQMSAGGFQLKGSGWYATDSKSAKKAPGTEPTQDAGHDSKGDKKAPGAEPAPSAGSDAAAPLAKKADGGNRDCH